MTRTWLAAAGVICLVAARAPLHAQRPANLLANTGANEGLSSWRVSGAATVETLANRGGNRVFVLRGGGALTQAVALAPGAAGRYLVFVAYALGDRLDRPGDITDQPYLYGLTMNAEGTRILSYYQGPTMGSRQLTPAQWGRLWGIFPVPAGAATVTFQMSQGHRRGTDRDGSAARFDDAGLFLFDSHAAAEAFVDDHASRVD